MVLVLNTCTNVVCWEAIKLPVQVLAPTEPNALSPTLGNVSNSFSVGFLFTTINFGCNFLGTHLRDFSFNVFNRKRVLLKKIWTFLGNKIQSQRFLHIQNQPRQGFGVCVCVCVCVKRIHIVERSNKRDCGTGLATLHRLLHIPANSSLSLSLCKYQCAAVY